MIIEYRYKVKDTDVLKIIETGDVSFQNAIYCLDASKSFPGTTSLTYKNVGDFKDSTNINVASLGLSAEDYTSLVWLVDNMYLKKQTPEQKDDFIAKAFAEEIEATKDAVLPTTVDLVKAYLTDDDKLQYLPKNIFGRTYVVRDVEVYNNEEDINDNTTNNVEREEIIYHIRTKDGLDWYVSEMFVKDKITKLN